MEQEFKRNDVNLNRQNMANWTIQCADRYLAILYDYLHKLMYGYHVLQADRDPGGSHKRTGGLQGQRVICGSTAQENPIRKLSSCMNTKKTGKQIIRKNSLAGFQGMRYRRLPGLPFPGRKSGRPYGCRLLRLTLSQKYCYSRRTANISVNRQFSDLNPE